MMAASLERQSLVSHARPRHVGRSPEMPFSATPDFSCAAFPEFPYGRCYSRCPEEACTDTAERRAKEQEPRHRALVVAVQTSTVEGVTDRSENQAPLETNPVVDGTGKNAKDGKETVDEGVGGRHGVRLCGTTSTETAPIG